MPQIAKETVEKVLAATNIVEVISSYIELKKAGTVYKACCPFHHEKTPSFTVNPNRQSFKCFGCQKGGDALSFVREYENLPFAEAVRRLASRVGVTVEEEIPDPEADRARRARGRLLDLHRGAAAFFHERLLKDPAAQHARDYLKSRGFGREMAERWQVGWMPERAEAFLAWAKAGGFSGRELVDSGIASLRDEQRPGAGLYVRFRDRLMFCVCNELGEVIAFSGRQLRADPNSGKYVNSPETAIFKKSSVIFALDRAKKPILTEKCALLCEGQIDAIVCHENGITHAVAPLGTAFTPQHARLLRRYTKSVLLCFDSDKAGIAASERAFRELAGEGLAVRMVTLPAGDDPDSFIRAHGVGAFRERLAQAAEYFDFKFAHARAAGRLDSAAERRALTGECVDLLTAMSDEVARDHQIQVVATLLQLAVTALRDAVAKALRKPKPTLRGTVPGTGDNPPGTGLPTPLHRVVGYLCHLALTSAPAQHFLAEQYECIHEATPWLEGVGLLERILTAAPDASSPAAVNVFLASLPEGDRLALTDGDIHEPDDAPADGMVAAEHALAALSGIVLQRRDARVKADLKQPGLTPERTMELLQETQEITALMRGIGQRHEFDDELPPSTYREKPKPKWGGRGRQQGESG